VTSSRRGRDEDLEWTAPENVRSSVDRDITRRLPDILVVCRTRQALAFASRTVSCVRPAQEVAGLMVSRVMRRESA